MKKQIIFLLYIISFNLLAESKNTYDVKIDLSLNGKYISSPRIILNENQEGNLKQKDETGKEHFIDLIIQHKETKIVKNGVLMKFAIGTMEKGVKKIVAKPHLFTRENQSAEISQSDEKGKENISIKVIAIKK